MNAVLVDAHRLGLINPKAQAAVDATGLSADGRSSHYAQRQIHRRRESKKPKKARKTKTKRYQLPKWPKITGVIDTASHLIVAAHFSEGPSHDSPPFAGLVRKSATRVRWDRLLADSGFDSEEHHRMCRKDLHIRSTLIAINPRSQGRKWPKTYYRRQMKTNFHRRKYGQRWQVESVWSRHKRTMGRVLATNSLPKQEVECQNRVLTHNLVLLALH